MNVRNCRYCGRLFNYVMGPIMCQPCREKNEKKFHEVKEFIRENKGMGIQEVAEACDVDPQQIRQWLREDRLELTEDSPMVLACESCGAPIRSGRYCDKCANNMKQGFNSILEASKPKETEKKKDPKDNPRMRFLQ